MRANGPSILVVDDDVDTCRNLSDILTDLGYRVDTAHDGFSALALVRQHAYDIALLDLKMPGMSGLELYRKIKQLQSGTVALVVTAYATSATAEEALTAGAWQVLAPGGGRPAAGAGGPQGHRTGQGYPHEAGRPGRAGRLPPPAAARQR